MPEHIQEPEVELEPEKIETKGDEFLMARREDLEPKEFKDGFTLRTVVGALFLGIIMMPGSIYLGLMLGQTLGPAGQWTTVILFTEIARRSLTKLSRQELYMIYYIAGIVVAGGTMGSGGAFGGLIWIQYLVQSPMAQQFNIASKIPTWAAPALGSEAYIQRTFLHHDWLIPIMFVALGAVLHRIQWIGMGYFLFRTTSDVERLPFPFAPISAQGATALAEVSEEKESWRWSVFSVGSMIGLIYGFFYVALPVISSSFMADPLTLIPIPFIDFMRNTEEIFPAGRFAVSTDLGPIFFGFVAPFSMVIGSFLGSIFGNVFFAPSLYRMTYDPVEGGSTLFPHYQKGMNLIQTEIAMNFDLYMSIGIGISIAIAAIGMYSVVSVLLKARVERATGKSTTRTYRDIPAGRGDFPIWMALGAWFLSTLTYVIICHILVPRFPIIYFIAAAFLWTPIMSYISARMIALTGQPIVIPYVAQATFILSGYKGVDIWFAPFPLADYGAAAGYFREVELTGTKFTSVLKAEAFLILFLLIASFAYWSFFWKSGPIPSSQYPFVQMFWPVNAFYTCLWATATDPAYAEGSSFLLEAIKFPVIGYSGGAALALYLALAAFKAPIFWFYGFVAGFQINMLNTIPIFTGAMLGRYYFAKRFGGSRWRQYTPILAAGYACGLGLIGMASIGLTIIFKTVRSLPF